MAGPRPEKVAVVEEVRDHLERADAAILTEYRGLKVADLATLRRALTVAGAEYKIYKNTLVRRATADTPHAVLEPLLEGPTAIAFVDKDVAAVAKVLREFARAHPALVVKGSFMGTDLLDATTTNALADLPSRDQLLAQIAGALAAPMRQMAGLLKALPQNLAYGLQALVDQRVAGGEALPVAEVESGAASGGETSAGSDTSADDGTSGVAHSASAETEASEPEPGGDAEAAEAEPTVEVAVAAEPEAAADESAEAEGSAVAAAVSAADDAEPSATQEPDATDTDAAGETDAE